MTEQRPRIHASSTPVTPDPRSAPRERDAYALRQARLLWDECASCHRQPSNVHHVVPRGAPYHGDDVTANLLLLCGTGTWRCHGAFHGNPYVDDRGRRWTENDVRAAVGKTIAATRPDTIEYVIRKLGSVGAAADYLARRYLVPPSALVVDVA